MGGRLVAAALCDALLGASRQFLATASDADCQTILGLATLVLAPWLRHAPLALQAAPRMVQFVFRTLGAAGPQKAAAAATTDAPTGFEAVLANRPLVEALFALLDTAAGSSVDCATALLESGAVTALRRALSVPQLLDSREFAVTALALLGHLCAASPEAALAVMLEGGHGVTLGLAAHWLLSGEGKDAGRHAERAVAGGGTATTAKITLRALHTKAGSVLGAMLQSSHDLRLDRAISEACVRADKTTAASAGGGRDAAAEERARRTKAAMTDEKALETLSLDVTPAEAICVSPLFEVPWAAAPHAFIDALLRQGRSDDGPVLMDVWFLPDPVRPRKVRRMSLALSPDLRILTWSYRSQHHRRRLAWWLDLSSVKAVHTGLPLVTGAGGVAGGYQNRLFKRRANVALSVSLEVSAIAAEPGGADDMWGSGAAAPPGGTATPVRGPLHLEAQTAEQHNTALWALSVLVQHARVRAGVLEPMPQVLVTARMLLGDDSEGPRVVVSLK